VKPSGPIATGFGLAIIAAVIYLATQSTAGIIGLVVLLGFITLNVVRTRRRQRRFVVDIDRGITALVRGDLNEAHDVFQDWAEQATLAPMAALARHNLAWTVMRQGDIQHSANLSTHNRAHHKAALRRIGMLAICNVDIALCEALLGRLDTAETELADVDNHEAIRTPGTLPAMKAMVRAVIDCRSGRGEDAARVLQEHWSEYEGALTGETLRPIRIVRAFAIAASGPRNAGQAETLLSSARPAYPGEYAFLGVAWPEMASFLAAHQLDR
jgi:hypothetical protein